ncbi:MAG: hypothetical protein LBB39_02625 [Mycoplasmataceae bacterium]|nr:hypothetical protein [Mycoplasmataceae bacterium]
MIKGGKGGKNTNVTGLDSENKIFSYFIQSFANLKENVILGVKSKIYLYENKGLVVDNKLIEKIHYKPQPDIFVFVPKIKKLWIIEIKNQDTQGTGWEKFEFGIYGYKSNIYQRIFKNVNVEVEGIYTGDNWNKIKYLDDLKDYVYKNYKKTFYYQTEINELIEKIKKEI